MDWVTRCLVVLFGVLVFALVLALTWPTTQTYTVRTCTSDGHGSYDCKDTP